VLASYVSHKRERKRTGKEREHICIDGEKDNLHGARTHTFCYPGRCPEPVRVEGPSNSPFSVGMYHHRR
jgi:hypothetical protein